MNKKLEEFKKLVFGKKVGLVGLGISNTSLIPMLISFGASIVGRDSNELISNKDELLNLGLELKLGQSYLDDIKEDIIFKTPGIRYDKPELIKASENGCLITSEMEMFCNLCPCKIFAITGSDGKTTTTTLTYSILNEHFKNSNNHVYVGGNIGTPLLCQIEKITEDDIVVIELSSFQLHTMSFNPEVSIITNISENHLNWHTDMNEYIDSKKNIYKNQLCGKLILDYDNEITKDIISPNKNVETMFFSYNTKIESNGAYLENDTIFYVHNGISNPILNRSDILVPGDHNVLNYMAAILATIDYVDIEDIITVAKTFKGVEHRIQLVNEYHGVKYYNSSIDSSPARTITTLNSFNDKLIVIVGGKDKNLSMDELIPTLINKSKFVVCNGQTGIEVNKRLKNANFDSTIYLPSLKDAVIFATSYASYGDIVLLSPAATSFDQFKNFEERGKFFTEIVKDRIELFTKQDNAIDKGLNYGY